MLEPLLGRGDDGVYSALRVIVSNLLAQRGAECVSVAREDRTSLLSLHVGVGEHAAPGEVHLV